MNRGLRKSSVVVGLVALIYGLPMFYLIITSFKPVSEIFSSPANPIFKPTLDAYRTVAAEGLGSAYRSSSIIATSTALLVLALGAPAAYWFARRGGRAVSLGLFTLILLQLVPQANSVIPMFRVIAQIHLVGSLAGVVLADVALLLPFAVLLMRPFFANIPLEVYEAARLDGARQVRTFRSMAFPLARNGLVTVSVMIWIIAWGEFLYAITFLPDNSNKPLSALLSGQVSQYGTDWNLLMAMAVLVIIPVVVVFLLAERRLSEGISLGVGK